MGRIDDALKRVAAEKGGTGAPPADGQSESLENAFVSPWSPEPGIGPGSRASVQRDRTGSAQELRRNLRSERSERAMPTVGLESQLAMNWPQPFAAEVNEKLVVMRGTDPAAIEQYRGLADALHQANAERGVKSVILASPGDGEGKTLTAVNLSLTLSQTLGGRVLLVDADVRQPRVHRLFQVSAGPGLSAVTAGQPLPAMQLTARLSLFSVGHVDTDAASLGFERMRRLLSDASQAFDWVVVDSAPLALVPDTGLLAAMVDAVVLVIEASKTTRKSVGEAVEALGRERLLGVVLNRTARSHS